MDQGLSSASNLLLVITVARSASPVEFGHFGVAYVLLYAFVGIGRSVVGTVASVTATDWTAKDDSRMHSAAISAAAQIGLVGSTCCIILVPFVSSGLGTYLIITAAVLPFVMAQDACRFVGFANGQPRVAIVADGAWLGTQLLTLAITASVDGSGAAILFLWGGASLPGLVLATRMLRVGPRKLLSLYWFKRNEQLIRPLWAEGVVISMAAQGAPLAAGIATTVVTTGEMRAVATAFGPLVAMSSGLLLAVLPVATRRYAAAHPKFWRPLMANSAVLGCAAAAWVGVVLATPADIGRLLLGDNWAAVPALALAQGALLALAYLGDGALLSLRVMRRGGTITAVRTLQCVSLVVAAAVGASWGGAHGALALMTVVSGVTSISAWLILGRALRHMPFPQAVHVDP